jgi:FAD/FMN-containing dehydrogenase
MNLDHIETGEVENLSASLRGPLIYPSDDNYDEARRVYNAMHDRRPSLIVQATDIADVIATVNFAREQGLDLAIRGGGHSVPGFGTCDDRGGGHSVPGFGTCDDGIVLDLGWMKGIRVDSSGETVRAEGGCTLGELNHATYPLGVIVPAGIVSTTGIAGLTLGGGMGYLSRAYGLSCDNLVSADVVTADGRLVTCDAERDPDLFWAIRGGGGNFGVVTSNRQ